MYTTRSPSPRAALLLIVAAAGILLAHPRVANAAQRSTAEDGALFLLLPVGARATAMGSAAVADPGAAEGVWWNPAAIAQADALIGVLHHSESLIGTGDAIGLILPFPLLGVLALSASTINFGEQELSDSQGLPTGVLIPRSLVLAATFASDFGDAVRAGLTYKFVQMRADCSGACQSVESLAGETSAIDFGIQVVPGGNHPLTYGATIRNVGPRLQVVDTEQADALPARVHVGLQYRILAVERALPESRLALAAELVDRLSFTKAVLRFGAEFSYEGRLFLRGGFSMEDGAGSTIGGGLIVGKLVIDIARVLDGLSADLGEPPTYVSLRLRFR